tara:strand:+ start:4131 stop:5063 length:933 start_codon:yes stop_codon:yes gene_type:complete
MGALEDLISALNNYIGGLTTDTTTGVIDVDDAAAAITNAANEVGRTTLTQQSAVTTLLNTEKDRIENNIQSVKDGLYTKKRMVELNESNRLRTEQYNKILFVVVITILIIFGIIAGSNYVPGLPDIIPQILVAMVGSFAMIDIFLKYMEINKRSKLDYTKLKLDPPAERSTDSTRAKAQEAGDLIGSLGIDGCSGPECCDAGTVWNTDLMKCGSSVPLPATPVITTTTLDSSTNPQIITGTCDDSENITIKLYKNQEVIGQTASVTGNEWSITLTTPYTVSDEIFIQAQSLNTITTQISRMSEVKAIQIT